MQLNNLIVGGVACCLGLTFLVAALLNWKWWFEMRKSRWLTARFGRTTARAVLAIFGLALTALGVAIGLGFRWPLF